MRVEHEALVGAEPHFFPKLPHLVGADLVDIDDTGDGIRDPFAGYTIAGPLAPSGRGLTVARRLADVVEIRTTPTGTLVRVHFTLG